MMHIHKCPKCNRYLLKEKCPFDNTITLRAIPLKYSQNKTIARIRREQKCQKN